MREEWTLGSKHMRWKLKQREGGLVRAENLRER